MEMLLKMFDNCMAWLQEQDETNAYNLSVLHDLHDSQKIKIKKKTKTPRITDEGWNSQKRLSDPVEKKMKEGRKDSCIFI